MSRKSIKTSQRLLPIPGLQQLIEATNSKEARNVVRAMLRVRKKSGSAWRGHAVVPPGSVLDLVADVFRRETDIPLELPLMSALSFVAGRLLKAGVKIDLNGQMIEPMLWTIVLATSGSGKTFAMRRVMDMTGETDLFPEPASAARFIQDLSVRNRSIWVRDEFGAFMKSLDQQTHLAELRDYMLRLYDGQSLARRTKNEEITIEDPALVILGLSVFETFKNCVDTEALVDGFAQRFGFIVAPADPARRAEDFPLYNVSAHMPTLRAAWDKLASVPLHPVYRVGPEAIEAFKAAFKALRPADEALPMSFFRRLMFSAVRYAAVYHLVLGDGDDVLTANDFGWAGRMVALHIEDARVLLDDYGLGELERVLRRVEAVKAEIEAKGGRCKPRDLIRRIGTIRTAEHARSLLRLIEEDDQPARSQPLSLAAE